MATLNNTTFQAGLSQSSAVIARYMVAKVIAGTEQALKKRAAEIVDEVIGQVIEEHMKDVQVEMFVHPITGRMTVKFDVNQTPLTL
jgi:hypothetical protein